MLALPTAMVLKVANRKGSIAEKAAAACPVEIAEKSSSPAAKLTLALTVGLHSPSCTPVPIGRSMRKNTPCLNLTGVPSLLVNGGSTVNALAALSKFWTMPREPRAAPLVIMTENPS